MYTLFASCISLSGMEGFKREALLDSWPYVIRNLKSIFIVLYFLTWWGYCYKYIKFVWLLSSLSFAYIPAVLCTLSLWSHKCPLKLSLPWFIAIKTLLFYQLNWLRGTCWSCVQRRNYFAIVVISLFLEMLMLYNW